MLVLVILLQAAGCHDTGFLAFISGDATLALWLAALLISGIASLVPAITGIAFAVFALCSVVFLHKVAGIVSPFTYNTHLIWLSCVFVCRSMVRGRDGSPENRVVFDDSALLCCRLIIISVYLHAGVSKLLHGGPEWFITGNSICYYTAKHASSLGAVFGSIPSAWKLCGFFTLVLELVLPIYTIFSRSFFAFGAIALSFHAMSFLLIGISFWHLAAFLPILFMTPNRPARASQPSPGKSLAIENDHDESHPDRH